MVMKKNPILEEENKTISKTKPTKNKKKEASKKYCLF